MAPHAAEHSLVTAVRLHFLQLNLEETGIDRSANVLPNACLLRGSHHSPTAEAY